VTLASGGLVAKHESNRKIERFQQILRPPSRALERVLGIHPPTHDLNRWTHRAHLVDSSAGLQAYGERA
jgi:hypothetical protein